MPPLPAAVDVNIVPLHGDFLGINAANLLTAEEVNNVNNLICDQNGRRAILDALYSSAARIAEVAETLGLPIPPLINEILLAALYMRATRNQVSNCFT